MTPRARAATDCDRDRRRRRRRVCLLVLFRSPPPLFVHGLSKHSRRTDPSDRDRRSSSQLKVSAIPTGRLKLLLSCRPTDLCSLSLGRVKCLCLAPFSLEARQFADGRTRDPSVGGRGRRGGKMTGQRGKRTCRLPIRSHPHRFVRVYRPRAFACKIMLKSLC